MTLPNPAERERIIRNLHHYADNDPQAAAAGLRIVADILDADQERIEALDAALAAARRELEDQLRLAKTGELPALAAANEDAAVEWERQRQITTIVTLDYLLAAWRGGDEPDITATVLGQVKTQYRQAIEEYDPAVHYHPHRLSDAAGDVTQDPREGGGDRRSARVMTDHESETKRRTGPTIPADGDVIPRDDYVITTPTGGDDG